MLTIGMICDKNLDTPLISALETLSGECNYQATFTGAQACPTFDVSAIWDFLNNYKWLWGIAMIVGGVILCAFGRKWL